MCDKIKTVIASVLKPVDDTRMYEKIGLSMHQTNRYEINIIGFVSKNLPCTEGIHFYPAFSMKRSSLKRFIATFKLLRLFIRIKPTLIIISTYEIIPAAWLYKQIRQGCKLIYDVRENYALNVMSNGNGSLKSKWCASIIRWLETRLQAHVLLNILAEKSYANETNYFSEFEFILNKMKRMKYYDRTDTPVKLNIECLKLVFSGTISLDYGVQQAIHFVNKMIQILPNITITFIGHVPNIELLTKLVSIHGKHFNFIIDNFPIPHERILQEIEKADMGIVAHQPTISIRNCFPTRIYEFMAMRKPFLLQNHTLWTGYCNQWDCCIPLDFNQFDAHQIAEQISRRTFYKKGIPDDIYWDQEEVKLLKVLDSIFYTKH